MRRKESTQVETKREYTNRNEADEPNKCASTVVYTSSGVQCNAAKRTEEHGCTYLSSPFYPLLSSSTYHISCTRVLAPQRYVAQGGSSGAGGCVTLCVVQEGELNIADQKVIQFNLWNTHGVKMRRVTYGQIAALGSLRGEGTERRLFVGEEEVSAIYLRSGYGPDDYTCEADWDARLMLERSRAIKAPSVAYQLVGAKKVQQELTRPGAVERYLSNGADATLLRSCFAAQYAMGSGADAAAVGAMEEAKAHPERFVMKPQREGGGNNLFGEDIPTAMATMNDEALSAHVLMQRIMPVAERVTFLKEGCVVVKGAGVFEMGYFCSYLGDGTTVLENRHGGHMLRSKLDDVDEGGVAAGFAVLNSPMLVG